MPSASAVFWAYVDQGWHWHPKYFPAGPCFCGCGGKLCIDKDVLGEALQIYCLATGRYYNWTQVKRSLDPAFKIYTGMATTKADVLYHMQEYKLYADVCERAVSLRPQVVEDHTAATHSRFGSGSGSRFGSRDASPPATHSPAHSGSGSRFGSRNVSPPVAQSIEHSHNQGSYNNYYQYTYVQNVGGPSQAPGVGPSGGHSNAMPNPIQRWDGLIFGRPPPGLPGSVSRQVTPTSNPTSDDEAVSDRPVSICDAPPQLEPTDPDYWRLLRRVCLRILNACATGGQQVPRLLEHVPAIDIIRASWAIYRGDSWGDVLTVLGGTLQTNAPGFHRFLTSDEGRAYLAPAPSPEEQGEARKTIEAAEKKEPKQITK